MNADQVLPQVVVGCYPQSPQDIDWLVRQFDVTAVLNLHTDEDIVELSVPWALLEDHYRQSKIEVRRVPITDFDHDDLTTCLPEGVRQLAELIDAGHTVYCHCTAGIGRSPSVVVAYLNWIEGRDLDEAAALVRGRRPCSPDLRAIRLAGRDSEG
ncbi:MAG: dual specificity protein phosphatase family protein [Planctomycetes bacterium]|nr:dual specificity protein phosphatase family protein [Planctomycetota bacterium]